MPPPISDDEASDASSEPKVSYKPDKKGKGRAATIQKEEEVEEESLMVESDNIEDEEDEGIGEDEYVVEAITNHLIDEDTGTLRFEVKWEGFEKKSDRTWEPEENLLETASTILDEYLASIGGKELLLSQWQEKKAESGVKRGRKRGRTSTSTPQAATNGAKRGRKSAVHPAETSPPASVTHSEFKPPSGNWEEEVQGIDACEGTEGNVIVFLTWKGNHKSQHPLSQVYKRCPQKMLKFYEKHLVFKKNDDA